MHAHKQIFKKSLFTFFIYLLASVVLHYKHNKVQESIITTVFFLKTTYLTYVCYYLNIIG